MSKWTLCRVPIFSVNIARWGFVHSTFCAYHHIMGMVVPAFISKGWDHDVPSTRLLYPLGPDVLKGCKVLVSKYMRPIKHIKYTLWGASDCPDAPTLTSFWFWSIKLPQQEPIKEAKGSESRCKRKSTATDSQPAAVAPAVSAVLWKLSPSSTEYSCLNTYLTSAMLVLYRGRKIGAEEATSQNILSGIAREAVCAVQEHTLCLKT